MAALTPGAPDPAAEANAAAVEAAVAAQAVPAVERTYAPAEPRPRGGGTITIPLLCLGIAIIAACLIIPQTDANRRLAYERVRLQADLEAIDLQAKNNDEFLKRIADDPNLAERLAQRQMKIIRKGNEVLTLKSDGKDDQEDISPFQLTAVPAPADLPPYQPRGGMLANLCYDPKTRLHMMGIGLLAMAAGLVMGFVPRMRD